MLSILAALHSLLKSEHDRTLEILALRQQLAINKRISKRPKLRAGERVFWVWLSRLWRGWQSSLIVVKPETIIGWHKLGFKLY